MTIPKSGFWCSLASIAALLAIALCIEEPSDVVLQRIVEAIGVVGGVYAHGRLKRDVRENGHQEGIDGVGK